MSNTDTHSETQSTTEHSSMENTSTERETVIGRVKWFNSRNGFGFITVTEGDRTGEEIFVHYTGIQVENEQYRYLVQGEYVSFYLGETTNSEHDVQAIQVRGVNQGKLMCETQRERKSERRQHRVNNRSNARGRGRGRGSGVNRVQRQHFTNGGNNEEWILIRRKQNGRNRMRGRGRGRNHSRQQND